MRFPRAMLVLSLAYLSYGDTRTVTKRTVNGHESITAEYVQGDNRRDDFTSDGFQRATIFIAGNVLYQLDLKLRQYVEQGVSARAAILPHAVVLRQEIDQSGKNVNIYCETVDTGERKEFFGKTAEHLILRERWVPEPGACGQPRAREREGWYVLNPDRVSHRVYSVLMGTTVRDGKSRLDKPVAHGHVPAVALAVLETEGPMKTEITDFSEAPLDPSVFEVPAGFTRVEALEAQQPQVSWEDRLRFEWYALLREINSWF